MSQVKIDVIQVDSNNKGWGNGYFHIPKDHPYMVNLLIAQGERIEVNNWDENITYSEWSQDREFYIIGFDTTHIWNTPEQDQLYVDSKTQELYDIVRNYTMEDAKRDALLEIESFSKLFTKYI